MSPLHERENAEVTEMIYRLDVDGIEERARKYRIGKYICLVLFVIVLGYFSRLRITEGYPIDIRAVSLPLLIFAVLWYRERDLMKAKKIMVETLKDVSKRQNQPLQRTPDTTPVSSAESDPRRR